MEEGIKSYLQPLYNNPSDSLIFREHFKKVYNEGILTPDDMVDLYRHRKIDSEIHLYILPELVNQDLINGNEDKIFDLVKIFSLYQNETCDDGKGVYVIIKTLNIDNGHFFNYYMLLFPNGTIEMIRWAINRVFEYPRSDITGRDEVILSTMISAAYYKRLHDVIDVLGKMGYDKVYLSDCLFTNTNAISIDIWFDRMVPAILTELIQYVDINDIKEKYKDNDRFKELYTKLDGV